MKHVLHLLVPMLATFAFAWGGPAEAASLSVRPWGDDAKRYPGEVNAWVVIEPDDTVIGGGNAAKLHALPPHSRLGGNANAFQGGFRLWEKADALLYASTPSKRQA